MKRLLFFETDRNGTDDSDQWDGTKQLQVQRRMDITIFITLLLDNCDSHGRRNERAISKNDEDSIISTYTEYKSRIIKPQQVFLVKVVFKFLLFFQPLLCDVSGLASSISKTHIEFPD